MVSLYYGGYILCTTVFDSGDAESGRGRGGGGEACVFELACHLIRALICRLFAWQPVSYHTASQLVQGIPCTTCWVAECRRKFESHRQAGKDIT